MTDAPPGTLDTDKARVRLVLTRELETISVYEALARQASAPEVRVFFEHLAQEEKEHVAEAVWLLRQLDSGQDADFQKSFSTAHFEGQVSSSPSSQPAAPGNGGQGITTSPTAATARPSSNNGAAQAQSADLKRPYIPEDYKLPGNPGALLHALPAPQTEITGTFTVGPLKRRR